MDLFAPLTRTNAPGAKLEPLTVRVNPEPPAVALAGDMLVSDGTGLFTVKARDELVPPPGVATVIDNVAAVARSELVRAVDNCVPLMTVVLRAAPLTWITEFPMKLLPVAVRVSGLLPAFAADGEMLLSVGVAAATVRLTTFDVQFPSDAFETLRG